MSNLLGPSGVQGSLDVPPTLRTPMGIGPIQALYGEYLWVKYLWVIIIIIIIIIIIPPESLENTMSTMGTLLGVHPIVP